jgi:hypothetical protein
MPHFEVKIFKMGQNTEGSLDVGFVMSDFGIRLRHKSEIDFN